MVVHSIFHSGSLVHFYVGDGEDALPVSARNFAFIPVLIYSANQCNTLPLQADKMTQTTHTHLFMYLVFLYIYIYMYIVQKFGVSKKVLLLFSKNFTVKPFLILQICISNKCCSFELSSQSIFLNK